MTGEEIRDGSFLQGLSLRASSLEPRPETPHPDGRTDHGPDGRERKEHIYDWPLGNKFSVDDLPFGDMQRSRTAIIRSRSNNDRDSEDHGRNLGVVHHLGHKSGKSILRIEICRRAASTSPGFAPRGQYLEQSLHWWQSQMSGSWASRSLSPHWVQIISFLGKGPILRGEVAHHRAGSALKALLEGIPSLGLYLLDKLQSGSTRVAWGISITS